MKLKQKEPKQASKQRKITFPRNIKWFNSQNSTDVINHINRIRMKNHYDPFNTYGERDTIYY